MRSVPCALPPAATAIWLDGLEIAAALAGADTPDAVWAMAYPRVAQCFPRPQACAVVLDLRDPRRQPQTYGPTPSQWLLLDECLSCHLECLHEAPGPQVLAALKASPAAQDAAYLAGPRERQGRAGGASDFEAWIDPDCWDTDGLLEASTYAQLGAPGTQQRGFRAAVCGVVSGLLPPPAELVLPPVEEGEAPGLESAEGHGELS